MTEQERWVPVPGFDNYEVSDRGRVRSFKLYWGSRGPRMLTLSTRKDGYLVCGLVADRHHVTGWVHRLVLLAFVGPRPHGMVVRHLDGDKANNALSNLAYGTYSENEFDKVAQGRHHQVNKTHCPQGHEYATPGNTRVYRGHRYCNACDRMRNDVRRQARHAKRGRIELEAAP